MGIDFLSGFRKNKQYNEAWGKQTCMILIRELQGENHKNEPLKRLYRLLGLLDHLDHLDHVMAKDGLIIK